MARRVCPVVGDGWPISLSEFFVPTQDLLRAAARIARVYGRQTDRASEIVRLIGYVAGGRPGQRLLDRLSLVTHDDTVLRRVRQKPDQDLAVLPVHNLGVDDWAWRKSQQYGTILVNLDAHRVVDLLPDRDADSFSEWLRQHPEIVTISRDRCGIYAEGAALGAPQSQQIADRFHLVLNLSATTERVLEERSRQLTLPPADGPKDGSQTTADVDAHTDMRSRKLADSRARKRTRERFRYQPLTGRMASVFPDYLPTSARRRMICFPNDSAGSPCNR